MLTKRVIATLLIKNGMLVKGRKFVSDRVVGHPLQAIKVFQLREADELVILDVGATPDGKGPDFDFIKELCREAFMPLTIGGGVRSIEDIRGLLNAGADKVVIGRAAWEKPILVKEAAEIFGSNCVVVTVDCSPRGFLFRKKIIVYQELGAGEILLQNIERDGMMGGYCLELIKMVAKMLNIPVVASSGCGCYEDMYQAIEAGADAVAAGAMWQFSENTPLEAKKYLKVKGINVRL